MPGMVRRVTVPLVAALVGVLLAGCGGDDDPKAADGERPEATDTTGAGAAPLDGETTSTTEAESVIVLRGDGVGVVDLGATPETAIAAVTAALGAPSRDTGWEPAFSEYGTCPGEQVRGVEWDHLVLVFTDGDTAYGSGPHLFTWRVTGAPPALGTARGLGYGATTADAEELYPGDVEITEPDDPFPGFLTVLAEGGTITAFLDGDTITNLEAGTPCGE